MNRRLFKWLFLLALMAGGLFAVPSGVYAEPVTTTVDVEEGYENGAIFHITWADKTVAADIELTAPDGTVYSTKKTPDAVSEMEGGVYITVPNAQAGTWTVTGAENAGSLYAECGKLPSELAISSFVVSVSGQEGTATLSLANASEDADVWIYADTDSDGYDGVEVANSSSYDSAKGTYQLDLSRLTQGEYHFFANVKDGKSWTRGYMDGYVSYQGVATATKLQVGAGSNGNDGYYARWNAPDVEDAERITYTVQVYDADHNRIDAMKLEGILSFEGTFASDQDKVLIAVTYPDSGYDLVEVNKGTKINAELIFGIEAGVTNQSFVDVEITSGGKVSVEGYVNDEKKLSGEEAGTYRVMLENGMNRILFRLVDESGTMKEFETRIQLDSEPPQLAVTEDLNGKVTQEDHVYISGYTESGATLKLNDKEITQENGFFNEKFMLSGGDNTIVLSAVDPAGNESRYQAVVRKGSVEEEKDILSWIIAGSVFLVLLVIYIIVFVKGNRRKKA